MNTYQNPIKKHGDFADPFVLRYNGRYYLYGTNPDVRCWSSDDLVNWTLEGPTVPEDEFPGLVPFAPEVVYWNGAFYMYTSPHGFGHYVLKSDSPTGPFRKITGNIGHSIDFSIFIDDDGQWYAYWADDRGIVGCKMNSPAEFGEEVLIGAYLHGWTEGPFVVKKDGKYHLTYTGNHFLSKGYRINAAVADNPLGPYRDDAYNPVIICTEGNVVGLGHSSTVLGPDLHTHYIVYHNLNPDKTRDLNIDPIVFTPEKAYVLGPTTTPRPVPVLPQWQCQRFDLQQVKQWYAENIILPATGIVEANVATCKDTGRYGISFVGADEIRLEFDRAQNTISVIGKNGLIACKNLLTEYDHEALHCIRLEYDSKLIVYIDNLLRLKVDVSLGERGVAYFADGALSIGSATVHGKGDSLLRYPVPCIAPADRKICFDIDTEGEYQFAVLDCSYTSDDIMVDGTKLLPDCVDNANGVAFYRCALNVGSHILQAGSIDAETIAIAPYFGSGSESMSVSDIGPFDKIRGTRKWANVKICASLKFTECGENWQSGVIFRAEHLADGGEGDDKVLGTNFFVGYRVCVSAGKIQLWKHRYDEMLLQEAAIVTEDSATFEIVAAGNQISVYVEDRQVLSYQDARPIMCGYVGFHARNCVIAEGSME